MSDLNDPRVLFAAERTLLAWSRTALTLMAFGFAVERFGLYIRVLSLDVQRGQVGYSFLVGILLLSLGVAASVLSVFQYRSVLATLRPAEIPPGYWLNLGVALNVGMAVLGALLALLLIKQRL